MHVSVGCQGKLPVDGGCTFMIFMAIAKLLSVEAIPHYNPPAKLWAQLFHLCGEGWEALAVPLTHLLRLRLHDVRVLICPIFYGIKCLAGLGLLAPSLALCFSALQLSPVRERERMRMNE